MEKKYLINKHTIKDDITKRIKMSSDYQMLVSVIIPTFNRAQLLKRCLYSIVNQTYKNLEIIIVDDFSTDNTVEIIKDFQIKDERIKYLQSKSKGGNNARNTGIFEASGEYIALMDDDDISLKNRIETQINAVKESNFSYDFIVSGYETRDENGKLISTMDYLKPLQSIGFPSRWLIKTDKLKEVGGFDPLQPAIQEIELFWRLREICSIYFDPTIVLELINTPISVSKNSTNMIKGIKRLLKIHGNKMNGTEYNSWIKSLCGNAAKKRDWKLFFMELKKLNLSAAKFWDTLLFLSGITHSFNIYKIYNRILHQSYKNKKIRDYKLL